MKCPYCNNGIIEGIDFKNRRLIELDCSACNGTCEINEEAYKYGQKIKELRLQKEITLRNGARLLGVNVSELSKLERGAESNLNADSIFLKLQRLKEK